MKDNTTTVEKRIVEQLDFGAKTARRVGWEAWEFSIADPHQVEVTNTSYGFEKDDHAYVISINKRDGVPVKCDRPADVHRELDCKHKVGLETVDGTTILNAAVDSENPALATSLSSTPDGVTTVAEKFQTNGGVTADEDSNTYPDDDARCNGPDDDDLPCFECCCDYEEEVQ